MMDQKAHYEDGDPPMLYPQVQLEKNFQQAIYNDRKRDMLFQKDKIEKRLEHINKLKRKWASINKAVKYSGLTLAVILASTATALGVLSTGGLLVVPLALTIISASSVFQLGITTYISEKICSKELNRNKRKQMLVSGLLNKLYIYIEKAKMDREITLEEIQDFQNILNEYSFLLYDIKDIEDKTVNKKKLKKIKKELRKEFQVKQFEKLNIDLRKKLNTPSAPNFLA